MTLAVVPAPASVSQTEAAPFRLSPETRVTGEADAAAALSSLVEARAGIAFAADGDGDGDGDGPMIDLRIERGGAAESYRIAADEASVVVTGADAAGLFYGVQTLGQLVQPSGDGWIVPAVEIDDAPRFAYRGVMLDVARHFHSVETVKGYIDRAAGLKMNALHLHLSDDQGWRIQLASRPKLTELASSTAVGGDEGGFYTKDDYRAIVEYAASRHMIVVPEIDMPGHTHAVSLAYPELVEEPVLSDHILEIARDYGGELPVNGTPYDGMAVGFSSLKIHDEATYDFVADVFGELAGMTPGPYLHLGGDEALGTPAEDFDLFVSRASSIIADLGKTPIAWHEAGGAADLDDATIGQYWGYVQPTDGMDEKARGFVRNGAQLILSPADAIYLDMKYPTGPELGLTWANGPTSVQRAYEWEPSAIIDGVEDSDILGVEAPMWAETIRTAADIDTMAFPRIAAAAEAAWSPATGESDLRTWESFRVRVGALGPLWTSLGIGFHPSGEIPWVTGVSTLVHSVRLVDDGRVTEDAWILFDRGRVSARGSGPSRPDADELVDGAGGCLVPGFVDIHGHGGAGASYDDGPEAIRSARALHLAHGTTRAVISLVTAPLDDLAARAGMVADLAAQDDTILGSHLEGPFLDPSHKGAHTEALLRAPDAASVSRLIEAGRGTIRQITLAPELPGALEAIARITGDGVVVAIGHTDADADTARRAFDAGASVLTHAFNAMRGIHHRAPGPVVAALRDPRVTLEVIADGVHVDLDLVATAFAAAGDRIALVTDAMAAAGSTDGRYELGGLAVTVTDGVARLVGGGSIAGSTLMQDDALRRVVAAGVALPTAVAALTTVPARAIGRPDLGRLDTGAIADAVLLDDVLGVVRVWVAGSGI